METEADARLMDLRAEARRYSEARVAGAAAAEVIAELREALEESEYHRRAAEEQLWRVDNYDETLGRVFTAADEEPPPMAAGLLDLTSGDVWLRHRDGEMFGRADGGAYSPMWHAWPLDGAGPFIALEDTWNLTRLNERASENTRTIEDIRSFLRDKPGGRALGEDGKPVLYPVKPIERAVRDVIEAKSHEVTEARVEARTERKAAVDEAARWADGGDVVRAVRDAAAAVVVKDAAVHSIVKAAELEIIQDCVMPEEGDPSYSRDRLVKAAALLAVAAARVV
jgi:hypothetical protein